MEKQLVIFRDLGLQDYQTAWDYQEKLLKANVEKKLLSSASADNDRYAAKPAAHELLTTAHYFLLVEHPPVYTLGKSGKIENLLISQEALAIQHIAFYKTNRGGDITFHGPQQIVGYPILDLEKFTTDIGKYLRNLEEVIILTLAAYSITGERSPGETGVWIDASIKGKERKICALGVRCSRWITMHGFALNVNTELAYFDNIIACGIEHKKVTSLAAELGKKVDLEDVKKILKKNFEKVFNVVLEDDFQGQFPKIL